MPCREKPDCRTWHIALTPQLCEDVCETAGVQQRREEPSPPADWGKNHKNIFHMQAAVNKPVKYLQACQGICNGDHSMAFECKSFCLGRQSSKVDAPGLLFSPRADPAIWLCWQRDRSVLGGTDSYSRNKLLRITTRRLSLQWPLYFFLIVYLIKICSVEEKVKKAGVRCGINKAQDKNLHEAQSTATREAFPLAQERGLIIGDVG